MFWRTIKNLRRELEVTRQIADMWKDSVRLRDEEITDLSDALKRIAAEEKPTSNSTVKRMAQMAREVLG